MITACLLAGSSYREPLFRVHLDHPPEQVLTVGRHEVGDVELASLHLQFGLLTCRIYIARTLKLNIFLYSHLFQELPEVVVVEGERPDEQRVQDDPARPHVRPPTVVLLAPDHLGEENAAVRMLSRTRK